MSKCIQLYESGARKFVIYNIPPLNRTPLVLANKNSTLQRSLEQYITTFNRALLEYRHKFVDDHTDAHMAFVNLNVLFNKVLDNVKSTQTTSGLTNTTGFCLSYSKYVLLFLCLVLLLIIASGTRWVNPNQFDHSCSGPENTYFWRDGFHPGSVVHGFIAKSVAQWLFGEDLTV